MKKLLASAFSFSLFTGLLFSDDYVNARNFVSVLNQENSYSLDSETFFKTQDGYEIEGKKGFIEYTLKSDETKKIASYENGFTKVVLIDESSTKPKIDTIYMESGDSKIFFHYKEGKWKVSFDESVSQIDLETFRYYDREMEESKDFNGFIEYCGKVLNNSHAIARKLFVSRINKNVKYTKPEISKKIFSVHIKDDTNIDVDMFIPEYERLVNVLKDKNVYKTKILGASVGNNEKTVKGSDIESKFQRTRSQNTDFVKYDDNGLSVFIGDALGNGTLIDSINLQSRENTVIFVNYEGKWFFGNEINRTDNGLELNGTYVRDTPMFRKFVKNASNVLKKSGKAATKTFIEDINQ